MIILTVTASAENVKYIDENGVEQTADCIIITGQADFSFERDNKWYAITSDVTIDNTIVNNTFDTNPARLILSDGCTLTAKHGIDNFSGRALIIYGQKNGTGTLIADASEVTDHAGIGGSGARSARGTDQYKAGSITINGGTVIAKGGRFATGIGGGIHGGQMKTIINGGTVTAYGGEYSSGMGRGYSVYGSQWEEEITINGGTVTVFGGFRSSALSFGSDRVHIQDDMMIYSGSSAENAVRTNASAVLSDAYVHIAPGTKYTVLHKQQNIDRSGYEQFETETLYDISGAKTKAVAKNYDGFSVQSFQQQTIAEDGSTVVEILYNRNEYAVSFYTYRRAAALPEIKGVYGATVYVDSPVPDQTDYPGYDFDGWYDDPDYINPFTPGQVIMPVGGKMIYGKFTAQSGIPYTVKHYYMNADGTDYILQKTETKYGTTGERTIATTYDKVGFVSQWFGQKSISGDGSTVIEIYYDRIKYTITFNANGHGTAPEGLTAYFEQPISAPTSPNPDGEYVFSGWFEDLACTQPYTFTVMPMNGKDLYAKWISDPSRIHTVTWTWADGTIIDTTKVPEGYMPTHANPVQFLGWEPALSPVTGDTTYAAKLSGNLTAEKVAVSFNTVYGSFVNTQVINAGQKAMKPENPIKDGCTFEGWYTDETYKTEFDFNTPVTENIVAVAKWSGSPAPAGLSLYGIVITAPPQRTSYNPGENFDPAGMVVNALYAKPITGYSLSPLKNLQKTDTDVTVTYTENGVTKTALQPITVGPVKEPYKIIVGADQVVLTTANSAVFSLNADFSKFVRVEVDGETVPAKYYTAKSGSTVITFNREYISKLTEGKHTLRIVSTDGSASTGFKVTSLPKTGDQTNPTLLMMLLLASMGTLLLVAAKTRKRNED